MLEKHEFNKKEAQQLMIELHSMLCILKIYCNDFYDVDDFINALILLKHILKISNKLAEQLDIIDVMYNDYEKTS